MNEARAELLASIAARSGKRRGARVVSRLAAVPMTVAVVVAGVWVMGGLVTNDFAVAMWLAAGWMAFAGCAAVAIALRSRAFAVPVVGAYLATAALLGVYLGSSVVFDDVVDERVASVSPESGNELLASGRFQAVRHSARGAARVIQLADGGLVLALTGFEVDNGPDLRVYLVAGSATTESDVDEHVDLGRLKGNRGNQQYGISAGVEPEQYSTVVIWCRAFSVLFARAPLEREVRARMAAEANPVS